MGEPTLIESALRHERRTAVVLLALVVASWAWIVAMARDMYGPMTGASAWMMRAGWDAPQLFLLFAMWVVMMTAMMLPSAAPLVLLYGTAAQRSHRAAAALQVYALTAGYLAAWAAFSLAATVLQRALMARLLVSPMMEMTSTRAAGALLVIAGLYQWTPMKHSCLRNCQSPLGFLMTRWRNGTAGAFRMGVEHGVYCVGCCWALMLLLFAGGIMNLTVIVAVAVFVALEKLMPVGVWWVRTSGALFTGIGIWMLGR
jgi:predicted metal-binding membrane protein